jgi:hypothetical protein
MAGEHRIIEHHPPVITGRHQSDLRRQIPVTTLAQQHPLDA